MRRVDRVPVGIICYYLRAMRLSDFHFDLPPTLIAQQPKPERTASRLLVVEEAQRSYRDRVFSELPTLLAPGDLLVFNDTRVIPARVFGRKPTGGQVEIMVERILDATTVLAQVRASKPLRAGGQVVLEDGTLVEVLDRDGAWHHLRFQGERSVSVVLDAIGHMPLPPYIHRADGGTDRERYQTVYARRAGAVAAPTAGLHFDAPLLARLTEQGVDSAFVTLHVGAGTFQPVREQDITRHHMHSEWCEVGAAVCEQIAATHARGGRVVAVGTTAVRSLETAACGGALTPFRGETDIFIYPGFHFSVVDALITNFHLPGSSLLMLVCAFAGYVPVMRAYRHAVSGRYRFFSYGDAMWVSRKPLGKE